MSKRDWRPNARCACGAPEPCWPGDDTCLFDDSGYPWCRVCESNHRAPECAVIPVTDRGQIASAMQVEKPDPVDAAQDGLFDLDGVA